MKLSSLLLAALLFSQVGFTADPPNKGDNHGMTPEMMKLMAPGENHKALTNVVGKFNYTMKWWMTPDAKAEESKGTSTSKWVLNGRFVQQEVKSKMNGQEFNGLGFTGYDNVKGEYQSTWMDSMGTGMMVSTGTMGGTNTLTSTGSFACPMTGEKDKWFRSELKVTNKNEHTFAMFGKTPEGKEFKTMEINYKRVN